MPENRTIPNNSELSPKQEMLIAALLSLPTIEAASLAAGVTSKTARLWMKQPAFLEAYKAAKQAVYDESLEGLRDNVKEAIDTLKGIMTSAEIDPAVRVRAANSYLAFSLKVHKYDENEAQIQEIAEALKRAKIT